MAYTSYPAPLEIAIRVTNDQTFYTGGFDSLESLRNVLHEGKSIDATTDPADRLEWTGVIIAPEHVVALVSLYPYHRSEGKES